MSEGIRRRDSNTVPLWHRYALTINEAAQVFNIGEKQLREMIRDPGCGFVLYIGRRILIKREILERYLENSVYI